MALQAKRVLLLEDEPIVAMMAEDLIRTLGASDIVRAATLEAAEASIDRETFDVALFDVNIHGDSSMALAEDVQSRGVPVVLASGYSHLSRDGGEKFIVTAKPFTLPKLKKAFVEALEGTGF